MLFSLFFGKKIRVFPAVRGESGARSGFMRHFPRFRQCPPGKFS
jgi:hypothetical protein